MSTGEIFFCYAHEDEKLRNELEKHLRILQRQGQIISWSDGQINAGKEWIQEIKTHLDTAHIILLLVSPDFMDSDYCYSVEMRRALERHTSGEARVIPVLLRPVNWDTAPFSHLQVLPTNGIPITRWMDQDEAFSDVARGILKVVKELASRSVASSSPDEPIATKIWTNNTPVLVKDVPEPKYLLFLIDQSGSTSATFHDRRPGAGRKKCDVVATLLNSFLNRMILGNINIRPDGMIEIKLQVEVTVLGYEGTTVRPAWSGPLESKLIASLAELQSSPSSVETVKTLDIDDEGNIVKKSVPFPVWVNPRAGGGTPMCSAIWKARELTEQWVATHPKGCSPVVVNITDGRAGDGDPTKPAFELCRVRTTQGNVLLYNVHLSDHDHVPPIVFPSNANELPDDHWAKQLFSISSIIPENRRILLPELVGYSAQPEARGLIFNGHALSIHDMLSILL